jgi:hypothetical protein
MNKTELAATKPLQAELSHALCSFLNKNECQEIVSDGTDGRGWTDGGCWILAEAYQRVLGGCLVGAYGKWGLEHVVCLAHSIYFDGDGCGPGEPLLERWRKLTVDWQPDPLYFKPFSRVDALESEIPYDGEAVAAIESRLRSFFTSRPEWSAFCHRPDANSLAQV